MKNNKGGLLERVYFEAIIMGLCVGLAALLLDRLVGEAGWPPRLLLLLLVGGALCLVQYVIVRGRR